MYGIIYCIKNTINGKVYIGRTKNEFARRYSGGKWWKYTCNEHLRRAALLYGIDAFEVSFLQECNDEASLVKAEGEWIEKLGPVSSGKVYNILSSVREYSSGSNAPRGELPLEVRIKISESVRNAWNSDDNGIRERHSEALSSWWDNKSESEKVEILNKRATTKANSEWRDYLSSQIVAAQALRSKESKEAQYAKQRATNNSKSQEEKAADYTKRADKRKAYWNSLTPEEREAKLTAKNAKIKATLLARAGNDDYAARVAKRQAKSPEEAELSEVKRLLDRFGLSWRPGPRSSWHDKLARFEELRAKLIGKPTVVIVAGQCGVGKTWVCENSGIPFVCYDRHKDKSYDSIAAAMKSSPVVLFDVPIRSKSHAKYLAEWYNVEYVVVMDSPEAVREQLIGRGSTKLSNVDRLNAKYARYAKTASFSGCSDSVLQYLVSKYGDAASGQASRRPQEAQR